MTHNLPDDWGMYYNTCGECGQRYHASGVVECACDRAEEEAEYDEDCYCGKKQWDDGEGNDATCHACGYGPLVITVVRSKIVTARKRHRATAEYASTDPDLGYIEPGEKYKYKVRKGYYARGPRFIEVKKYKMTNVERVAVLDELEAL